MRYRDSNIASHRGEKYVTEKSTTPEYNGGSKGLVQNKGKRGPGWIKG